MDGIEIHFDGHRIQVNDKRDFLPIRSCTLTILFLGLVCQIQCDFGVDRSDERVFDVVLQNTATEIIQFDVPREATLIGCPNGIRKNDREFVRHNCTGGAFEFRRLHN